MSNVLLNNSILAIYGLCLWKPSEIVLLTNRSKLLNYYKKMQYVWSLITLVSLVFSFSAVYQWIRLISLFILIVFWEQKQQNILFCTDQLAAESLEECSVLNILNFTCRTYRILALCLAFGARIRLFRLARGKP
jgi:hypothetical protein